MSNITQHCYSVRFAAPCLLVLHPLASISCISHDKLHNLELELSTQDTAPYSCPWPVPESDLSLQKRLSRYVHYVLSMRLDAKATSTKVSIYKEGVIISRDASCVTPRTADTRHLASG